MYTRVKACQVRLKKAAVHIDHIGLNCQIVPAGSFLRVLTALDNEKFKNKTIEKEYVIQQQKLIYKMNSQKQGNEVMEMQVGCQIFFNVQQ